MGHLLERMPMNITPHQLADLDELRRRIRQETNAKQRDRWRAVLLALEGKTTIAIMDKLGRSKNFVQRWVYFYRDRGLERVRPLKQPGKPPLLPPDQHPAFLDRINNSQRILRGRDIVEVLRQEFGVVYSLNAAYDLLHRLGYEPLRPRPVNPKKNPEEQQAWKHSAPLLSKGSSRGTRTSESKSGSKTNAASGRKDA
jgi:transposase